jgi:hypothetical protein
MEVAEPEGLPSRCSGGAARMVNRWIAIACVPPFRALPETADHELAKRRRELVAAVDG